MSEMTDLQASRVARKQTLTHEDLAAADKHAAGAAHHSLWSYCPFCGVEAPRPTTHHRDCPGAAIPTNGGAEA